MNSINETGLQNCARKDFVAFEPTALNFVKAAAAWAVDAADGSLTPAASAYVAGVLSTDPDSSGTGTIITDGVLAASDVFIDNSGPGDYYLKNNGMAVKGVPAGMLPVYCGTLTASGNFILRPSAPEFRGHRHTNHQLTGDWTSGNDGYVYDEAGTDTIATNILAAVPRIALSVIKNGELLTADDYDVINGKLVLVHNPGNADIVICTINPLIATDSEVRAISPAAENNIISVGKAYGTVYLDTEFPVVSTENTGTCVTSISKSGISTAPVVHSITAGGGTTITETNGVYTITNTGVGSTYIDFQTINANNVLVGGAATDALITFPAGLADASFIGIARIPAADQSWSIKVFLWITGDTLTYASALSGVVKIQSASEAGVPIVTTGTSVSFTIPSGTINNNNLYELRCTETLTAAPNSLVTVVISANTPSSAIQVNAAGVCLL